MFQKGQANVGPAAGFQFFGEVNIALDGAMTVTLRDMKGTAVYEKKLEAL
jgi:hypothetical protein